MDEAGKRGGKAIRLWGLAPTLVAFVGGLVLFSSAGIGILQWQTSSKILATVGMRSVDLNLDLVESAVDHHLTPARRQIEQIAALIEDGRYGGDRPARLRDLVRGAG